MKFKAFFKNLILLWTVLLFAALSVFCVCAEEEIVYEPETFVQEETEAPTEPPPTEAPEEAPTEPTAEPSTQAPEEAPTEPPAEYVPDETDEPEQTETYYEDDTASEENYEDNTEVTFASKTLPTVAPTEAATQKQAGDYTYGYASWACVAAGILVLAAVMISTVGSGRRKNKKR